MFWEKINKRWRRKVMRRNLYGAIAGIIPALLLSVAMLISAFHYNVAQAKSRSAVAVACGKELKIQCSGVAGRKQHARVPRVKFPEDALDWRTMLCACVIEVQCSFAKASSRVRTTFLDV
ncbi:MAG: hypothetical protein WAN27_01955 [Xanthobacteraceae bacterium]